MPIGNKRKQGRRAAANDVPVEVKGNLFICQPTPDRIRMWNDTEISHVLHETHAEGAFHTTSVLLRPRGGLVMFRIAPNDEEQKEEFAFTEEHRVYIIKTKTTALIAAFDKWIEKYVATHKDKVNDDVEVHGPYIIFSAAVGDKHRQFSFSNANITHTSTDPKGDTVVHFNDDSQFRVHDKSNGPLFIATVPIPPSNTEVVVFVPIAAGPRVKQWIDSRPQALISAAAE